MRARERSAPASTRAESDASPPAARTPSAVQREATGYFAPLVLEPSQIVQALDRARGGGQPLPDALRARLEPALGGSLQGARLHTDAEADRLSRSLAARAFTTGDDIYFRAGAYAPGTAEGERLLTHEATHVLQQRAGPVPGRDWGGGLRVSEPGDAGERGVGVGGAVGSGIEVQREVQDGVEDEEALMSRLNAPQEGTDEQRATVSTLDAMVTLAENGLDLGSAFVPEGTSPLAEASAVTEFFGYAVDVMDAQSKGQTAMESVLSTTGGALATKGVERVAGGPVKTLDDYVFSTLDAVAQLAGAPEEVTDLTGVFKDMTPSEVVKGTGANLLRAASNIGDPDGWERQKTDIRQGDSGAVLKGWAAIADVGSSLYDGDRMEQAISNAAQKGKDSSIGRLGDRIGAEVYQFFNETLPEARELASKPDGLTPWEFLMGEGSDEGR